MQRKGNSVACIKKEDCYGCSACGDICPTSAIYMELDEGGFWYPVIDEGKCIECNRCMQVCVARNYFK